MQTVSRADTVSGDRSMGREHAAIRRAGSWVALVSVLLVLAALLTSGDSQLTGGNVAHAQSADPPAKPTGLTASSVSHDSVTLTWDDPEDGSITSYQVLRRSRDRDEYEDNRGPAEFVAVINNTGSATTTSNDTSVSPRTRYIYRIKAKNGNGLSERSTYLNVETLTALAKPTGLTASSVSHDSVTLTWDDPGDDSITGYQVLRRSRDGDEYGDGQGAAEFVAVVDDTGSTATTHTDTSVSPRTGYIYRVKARKLQRLGEASDAANAETSETPASQPAQLCEDGYVPPTPTDVAVTAVPIVVTSTTADYFVLYASFEEDSTTVEYPVLVKKGEDGTTTLAENVAALPADRYRVEKYAVSAPADVDGDCTDDITELNNLGAMNPVNPAAHLASSAVVIPDFETFDRLSFDYDNGDSVIKFLVAGRESEQLQIYFMDTVTFNEHRPFLSVIGVEMADVARGRLIYDQDLVADGGSPGVYRYRFTQKIESFSFTERVHTLLAANMPLLDDNLALWIKNKKLREFQDDLPLYRSSRINIVFDDDIYGETDFLALNQAAGYGLLRELSADERPHPRDVVIYQALPNELPRVAGIISTVPQTPLSHVNLRAAQDGVPNAFIADALENDDVSNLIGSHVYYQVTDTGYTLRAATPDEVDAHFASSRPARTQTPQRDLTVTAITPLSDIDFDDWDALGVKAANVAVLGTLEFPEGTVPDGFAIPFYFYDEFMKHNDLYDDIEEMLADSDFQTDYDTMASDLKKLRKKIKKAEVPEWIETALTTMHGNYPDGESLRYRSSTNNEDLPNFNGAGLYDSKTQHPEETEEDGISKSLKQVYASLWNFRAFLERDFHRIDHLSTYMGALVHPNYSDDRVNGVAVSFDPATGTWRSYYVNAQVGEDLVTNPEVNSVPEELLLNPGGGYTLLALSNQAPRGDLLMTDDQMAQLRRHLVTIHDRFAELYGVRYGEAFAMEIEFKVTSDNVLAIKQARPWVFPPLTGRFDLDTEAHGGSPFTVRVRFSAPTTILRSNLRDRAVSVTGGRVTGARRTTYSPISEWWEIDVTPDSLGDVTIAVAHNLPCNNVAAICTSDGKRLSNRLELTIKGYLNNPATGLPSISGTPQVGETLTADTSGIVDEDGLGNVSYSYQWLRNDGTTDFGIQDAVNSTYTLVSDDSGKTIKVQVSFTDDAGNEEALTSDATAVVAAATSPNNPATGAPTISGAAQVGETLTADASGIVDEDGLSNPTFSYQWTRNDGTTDSDIQDATGSTYTLVSQDSGKAIRVRVSFTDDLGYGEILTSAATAEVTAGSNRTATGLPTITGTLEVLQTLRAQTSGIGDDDGLDNVSFEYQWAALGGGLEYDIQGATGPTYTLRSAELGKTIKVRVSFDDDRGYRETLTSAATEEVSPAPNTPATGSPTIRGSWAVLQVLTASTAGIADENGVDSGSFTYQWLAVDGGVDTDIEGATNPAYRLSSAEQGKAIKVRVGFIDNGGNEETLTSAATATVRADRVGRRSCPAGAGLPSPTDVAVTSVPIVVESTTDDYFVLYSSQTVDGTRLEYPVLVKRGEDQDDCKVGQEGLQREGDERWECVDMGAEESLFQCLEQVPDPRKARGVRHPFQAILRLTLLGLVCGQTTMAHIALFAKMHWPVLREPLGFLRDDPPHATTISRTLAGVPCEQLQGALTGWVARVAADQELDASVDGKWAKQSEDAQGNPLVMVNVLAHGLKLCLAQWPASEKRYEPRVLREQLGRLFEDYPGLRLLTMDALYAERDLCQAIVDHGRDYLVRVKGNQPTVLAALTDGFAPEELGEPQAETLEKKRV